MPEKLFSLLYAKMPAAGPDGCSAAPFRSSTLRWAIGLESWARPLSRYALFKTVELHYERFEFQTSEPAMGPRRLGLKMLRCLIGVHRLSSILLHSIPILPSCCPMNCCATFRRNTPAHLNLRESVRLFCVAGRPLPYAKKRACVGVDAVSSAPGGQ